MKKIMNQDYKYWLGEKLGDRCVKSLKKHGFDAFMVDDVDEARKKILEMVSGYNSFGFGGSDTVRKTGLIEALESMGKMIYDHWKGDILKEASLKTRLDQGRADCFFCSANAISATGEIINVDAVGNRTNAMCFGPGKVVIIAGINKITADLDSGIKRIKEIAAPMRAKSLNMETPCAETGICTDCNSPQRICRITAILHRKPMMTDVTVILVNQELGY